MKKPVFKNFFQQLRLALRLLIKNDPLRLAGATAFFATFALPFILIILLQMFGFLFDQPGVGRQLFMRLSDMLGGDSVSQVGVIIRGFRGLVHEWWAVAGGSLFMLFVATTLFRVIKNSFNQLWMIRVSAKKAFRAAMISRLRSLLVILLIGVLFITEIMIESVSATFGHYINEILPGTGVSFHGFISILISLGIVMAWFAILFRYIAEGRPGWNATLVGALLTSLLFTLGKYILRWLLIDSNIQRIFGAAGAFVLLLLFVFYTSLILYYGAAFTRIWGMYKKQPMKILADAVFYELHEVH